MTDSLGFSDDLLSRCIQMPLNSRDLELYELAKVSGITIDPQVFKVLVELLRLDVSPAAIFNVLQMMTQQALKPTSSCKKSSHTKNGPVQTSSKKKPPVAAKPKKIRVENAELVY